MDPQKCECPEEDAFSELTQHKWAAWIAIFVLVCFSALFSGLTLGLLGLDKIGLDIVAHGENERAARNAKKIKPVRANGNLLLCTLLFGNVAVNTILSIFTGSLLGELYAMLFSTTVIVIFGEIIPQAACNRYALQVGAASIPLVKVLIILFYVIAKPIAMILDFILGEEVGTIHTKVEIMRLLDIHVKHGAVEKEEHAVVTGALKFKEVVLGSIMTPIEDVYMLPVNTKLDFDVLTEIFKTGYSRIPVYGRNQNNIVGLLYTKDLLFIDAEDCAPLERFLHVFGRRVEQFSLFTKATTAFTVFKSGKAHMGMVMEINDKGEGDPFYEVKGVVTIEDLIEEILQDEIVDETDVFINVDDQIKVNREYEEGPKMDLTRIRLFNPDYLDAERLLPEEIQAMTAHLMTNYQGPIHPEATATNERRKWISRVAMHWLLSERATVVTRKKHAPRYGDPSKEDFLYKHGEPTDVMIMVMTGQVLVWSGKERIRSVAGAFSVFAIDSLSGTYQVDVSVCVNSETIRIVQLKGEDYRKAVQMMNDGYDFPMEILTLPAPKPQSSRKRRSINTVRSAVSSPAQANRPQIRPATPDRPESVASTAHRLQSSEEFVDQLDDMDERV